MEKPSRLIGSKFLKFLSKAAQPAVSFRSPPPSPRKASGPMIRIIPAEARRRSRNGISFSSRPEPTSPKVSCMGQVNSKKKNKKKKSKNKSMSNQRVCPPPQESTTCNLVSCVPKDVKRTSSNISAKVPTISPKEGSDKNKHEGFVDNSFRAPERVPSLGQMKRFASSRSALAGLVLKLDVLDDQFDDLKNGACGGKDHEKVEMNVPISAHKVSKEVDLRTRRTIPPLMPLQL